MFTSQVLFHQFSLKKIEKYLKREPALIFAIRKVYNASLYRIFHFKSVLNRNTKTEENS